MPPRCEYQYHTVRHEVVLIKYHRPEWLWKVLPVIRNFRAGLVKLGWGLTVTPRADGSYVAALPEFVGVDPVEAASDVDAVDGLFDRLAEVRPPGAEYKRVSGR
jgi:hypothetical protein